MSQEQVLEQPISKLKTIVEQFAKFFLVGIMNTGVDLIILNILIVISGIAVGAGYSAQKAISFLAAVTFSYFINKHWTFQDKSKESEGKKMSQFFAVSFVGMIINVTTATIVVNYFQTPINNMLNLPLLTPQLWGNLGALCGTAVGLGWNFVGYKLWVFKK
ncbi:MAG: glycosyl transferase family 2 [uncultured bacterium]|nr:MAG: glycosyl transferase family 2 [uncultured bacterium]